MHRIHMEEIAKASQHVFDLGKLQSHWTSPFIICIIYLHGVVEVWMVCLSRLISTCVKSFCQKKKKKSFSCLFSDFRLIYLCLFSCLVLYYFVLANI